MNKLRHYLVLMAMLLPLAGWCAEEDRHISPMKNVVNSDLKSNEPFEFQTEIADGLNMWFTVNGEGTVKVGRLPIFGMYHVAVDGNLFDSYPTNPKFTSLTIPEHVSYDGVIYNVTELGQGAFYGIHFKSLTLPSTLEKIDVSSIKECRYLTDLVIPKSVTSISEGAISGLTSIKSYTVEEGNPKYYSYNNAIINRETHTLLVGTAETTSIPENVTRIGEYAFWRLSGVNLILPDNVVTIGAFAFSGTDKLNVTLAENTREIGEEAFAFVSGIITVKWSDDLPSVNANTFEAYNNYDLALKVPAGAKNTYLATEGWNKIPAECIFQGTEGDEFTVKVGSEQIEMTFTVIESSQDSKKVKVGRLVGDNLNPAVDSDVQYTSIEIPESVTYKGENYIVTELGAYSFSGVIAKSITLPSTLETIRTRALSTEVPQIVIPKSVTKIEPNAFDTYNLPVITVEEGNSVYTSTGNALIENGTRLIIGSSKTVIPSTVTEIAANAFGNLRSANMIIPSSVVSIGSYAFAYCFNCKFFVDSPEPAQINSDAFGYINNCSLVVPKGSVNAYENAEGWRQFLGNISESLVGTEFQAGVGYENIQVWFTVTGANTVKVGRLEGSETNLAVETNEEELYLYLPETIENNGTTYNVTGIGSYAFYALQKVSVKIPLSVTYIDKYAFANCQCGLEVSWMDPITVDETAFLNVSEKVSGLLVPAFSSDKYRNSIGWKEFKDGIYEGNSFLYEIQDGIKAWFILKKNNTVAIGNNSGGAAVDKNLFDLQTGWYDSLIIPESITIEDRNLTLAVTELGAWAFHNLLSLKAVTIPSSIEKLGRYVFSSCYFIESIVIPKNVTSIGESAFYNCSSLKDVYSEIKTPFAIDASVFKGISSDAVLHVPFGCKALYEAAEGWNTAFSQIVEMKEEIVTNDVTYEMTDDNKIEVKTAEVNATTGSVSIAQKVVVNEVAVPVTAIAPKAFQNVEAVKSVTIPATVESIGDLAFAGCTNLKEVLCLNPNPVDLSVAAARGLLKDGNSGGTVSQFEGVDLGGCTLYVLTGAEDKYKASAGWKSFGTIKPFAGMGDVNTDKAIDVSDVVGEVNQILGKASDGFLYGAGDMNADNSIDVSDVVSIVNVILGKTSGARSMERLSAVAETTASDHLSLMAGNEGGLSLVLDNTADYIAAQFDVRLSEGQTLEKVVKGQRARGHQLATAKVADDTYRVLLYTIGDRTFSGQSGEVVSLGVAGEGSVSVENITFITAGESRKKFDDLSNQLTGIDAVLNNGGETTTDNSDGWYDLRGQRLDTKPTKAGVYVRDGRKVVVK